MAAWINGALGILLSFGIGMGVLGWEGSAVLRCVLASIGAGFVALTLTLRMEGHPWIRREVLTSSIRTWIFFLSAYFGLMLLGAPTLFDFRAFAYMVIPLVLCTGFTILAFGPLQDRRVARAAAKKD